MKSVLEIQTWKVYLKLINYFIISDLRYWLEESNLNKLHKRMKSKQGERKRQRWTRREKWYREWERQSRIKQNRQTDRQTEKSRNKKQRKIALGSRWALPSKSFMTCSLKKLFYYNTLYSHLIFNIFYTMLVLMI
jgi:hypothetical protein